MPAAITRDIALDDAAEVDGGADRPGQEAPRTAAENAPAGARHVGLPEPEVHGVLADSHAAVEPPAEDGVAAETFAEPPAAPGSPAFEPAPEIVIDSGSHIEGLAATPVTADLAPPEPQPMSESIVTRVVQEPDAMALAPSEAPAASAAPPGPAEWFGLGPIIDGARLRLPGALRALGYAFLVWLASVVFLVLAYRFVDPPVSNLMIIRWLGGSGVEKRWVPVERMSPQFIRAVIASEDARFCRHAGLDVTELFNAVVRARGGVPRGASTISMQVVKNLFLWPSQSYLRKVIEAPLTLLIEAAWPKWRTFEIYANIAEWGPGVFGVEAAARHHFGTSALRLTEHESALLAAALPNPIARNAGRPGPGTARLSRRVQTRMRGAAEAASCVVRRARSETRIPVRAPRPSRPGPEF